MKKQMNMVMNEILKEIEVNYGIESKMVTLNDSVAIEFTLDYKKHSMVVEKVEVDNLSNEDILVNILDELKEVFDLNGEPYKLCLDTLTREMQIRNTCEELTVSVNGNNFTVDMLINGERHIKTVTPQESITYKNCYRLGYQMAEQMC